MKRLFFDIETSYNKLASFSVGHDLNLGYNTILEERKIICICYKWEDDKTVYHLTWDSKHSDKDMLKTFVRIANQADEVVAHNGDRFDLPWIRTRCLIHRIPFSVSFTQVDTLKMSRYGFKFNSNRLDYLGQIMKEGRKNDHSGLDLWIKIVEKSDKKAMKQMLDYCKQDVLLLEKVFKRLYDYSKPKTHKAVFENGHRWGCPTCGNTDHIRVNKTYVSASGVTNRYMQCNNCHTFYKIGSSVYKQYLQDKRNEKNIK